jgi:hypothetical protein
MSANIVPAAVGLALFGAYVGFLAIRIAAPPLLVIVGAVVLMCVVDFVLALREE